LNDKPYNVMAVERFDCGANNVGQFRAGPVRLKQQIMRPAQGKHSAFDGQSALLQVFCGPQALRSNRHDCRQHVLCAMMQLFQKETLQSLGGLILRGNNSSLCQEARGIDSGLRQQVLETGIFRFDSSKSSNGLPNCDRASSR
jgi:hypothetical protein